MSEHVPENSEVIDHLGPARIGVGSIAQAQFLPDALEGGNVEDPARVRLVHEALRCRYRYRRPSIARSVIFRRSPASAKLMPSTPSAAAALVPAGLDASSLKTAALPPLAS